ncbi:MAG: porin [Micropepsaceae bacterium]
MKRFWPALTAATVIALSAPAFAGEWSYEWGGQGNLTGYGIDQEQTATSDLNNFGFAAEGKLWGKVRTVTESGIEIGLRGQLRFQSSEHEFSNDLIHGAPDVIDEVWMYIQTAFGRVTVGLEDGAGDSAGIYSPTVSDVNRLDDARAFPLRNPLATSYDAFAPNGAHIRTDLNASGDALKIIYYSPRLIGVQLSGSYTPELTRGVNELVNSNDDADKQGNIWEVGLNYQGSLSAFDVGFYAGYVAGSNENPTTRSVTILSDALGVGGVTPFTSNSFTPGDLEEWGAGAQVAWEGLKVGGSYRVTNVAGGGGLADGGSPSVGCSTLAGCVLPDSHTTIWGAGATYETGPWRIGAEYVNLEEELPRFVDNVTPRDLTQDATGWAGSVGYEFDENARIVAGYQHYSFDGPGAACVTGITSVCDTMDANLGYLQTSISF